MSKLPLSIPDGYELTEHGVFPKEWDIKAIGEIASVSSGGTPNRKVKDFWDGDIPWVTTTLINGNDISYANEFITKKGLESSSAKMCKAGTILMAMYGQGKTRGKAGVLTIDASINQACAAIEVNSSDSGEYILHTLNYMYEDIRELSNSGGQENLSSGIIKGIILPLPSKSEQTTIANALSDVDALLTELEKLIAKKQAIKTATMQRLLTGKTRLPQFATCTEGEKKGQPKGTKPSELGEIPEDWDVYFLDQLITSTQLGGNYSNSEAESSFPLIKMGNLVRGKIKLDKLEYANEAVSARDRLKFDDVLFNTRNTLELVGKVAIWKDELPEAYFNSNIMRFVFNNNLVSSNSYMNAAMNTKRFVTDLAGIATGTTSVAAIYTRDLLQLKLLIPPKQEQTAIATILSDMDNEIQTLEQRLVKTRQIKQGMMQELLTGRTRLPFDQE